MENVLSLTGAICGIIGAVCGVSGLILSFFGLRKARMEIITDYYRDDRSIVIINARKKVYQMEDGAINKDDDVSQLINFYHYCGIMLKLKYLPSEVFKTGSGIAMIRLYKKLIPTIDYLRKENPMYADGFEYLFEKSKEHHASFLMDK